LSVDEIRVGLVGAGNIAQVAQLPVLAGLEFVRLVGVTTSRRESAEWNVRRWPIERAYPDVEAMLESARLDCLFVLTPRREHQVAAQLAIEAGVDVFCEKPLAQTSDDALRLAEQADRAGRVLMVNLCRRYGPMYRVAREAFAAGEVRFCVAQKNRAGSEYRATLENAIHMIDLLRWFCGEAVEVTAHAIAADPWQE
jgi:virulence factor